MKIYASVKLFLFVKIGNVSIMRLNENARLKARFFSLK